MEEVSYDAGEYVFAHGDASDAFYVIVLGEAHVMCSSVGSPRPFKIARLGQWECFGERALVAANEEPRNAGVLAVSSRLHCLRMSRAAFEELPGALGGLLNPRGYAPAASAI